MTLFADARDGRFDRHTLAEACLVAGGVTDPRERQGYLDRLDRLAAAARKATAGSQSAEKAGQLLKFLHAGPMARGFRADQTDLHVLLDTGEFNCVSAAALYVILGRGLGLDVRAVEVPEHTFVVLAAGDRTIDVEPTDPHGLDPGRESKARRAGRRRELGEPGLAALVAYNHGVSLANRRRFADAVRANLVALALDPENPLAARNATAGLVNWPVELLRAGQYSEAVTVLAVGRELVPGEAALIGNTRAVFDAWADESMRRQDWAAAARVYEAGLGHLPGDKHLTANLAYCRDQTRR